MGAVLSARFITGFVLGVAAVWAFHAWVRPLPGNNGN